MLSSVFVVLQMISSQCRQFTNYDGYILLNGYIPLNAKLENRAKTHERVCIIHIPVHDTSRKVRTPRRKGGCVVVQKVERGLRGEHQSEIGRVNLPTNNKVSPVPLSSSASSWSLCSSSSCLVSVSLVAVLRILRCLFRRRLGDIRSAQDEPRSEDSRKRRV